MKMTYNQVKQELAKCCEKTTHFTKAFYRIYIESRKKAEYNTKHGIDDLYQDGIVWTHHSFDDVRTSKFYNLNSCAYCKFLEIVHNIELV